MTAKNNPNIQPWELKSPKDIRAGAIRDLNKNYTTAFSLLKSNQIRHFKMSYCRKKDTPSIEIQESALEWGPDGIGIYMKEKIKVSKRQAKRDRTVINSNCRLMVKNNQWYLVVPIKVKREKSNATHGTCALDPGVRKFQTVYAQDEVLKIKVEAELVSRLQSKLDKFQSLRDNKIISKHRWKRAERKLYQQLNDYIDDMHYKTANTLTNKYDTSLFRKPRNGQGCWKKKNPS